VLISLTTQRHTADACEFECVCVCVCVCVRARPVIRAGVSPHLS